MKKSIIASALVLSLGLLASSCSEEGGNFGSGNGRIAPSIGCDSDVEGMGQTLSRAGDDITVDDLSLTLSKDDGSYRQTWDKVSDFDPEKQFTVGNYTLTAFYGDPDTEGYEMPAYAGSVPVRVADGQTSQVSLTATIVNAKVTVVFTDEFKNYMTDYSGQFVTTKGTHQYTKDETRPLYIAPGQATFNVHVTKPNGLEANFEIAKINAQARHHYIITVNVNGGNVSDAVLEVNFDDTLNQEPVTIDLSDAIMSTPAPSLTTQGYTEGTPVELIAGVPNSEKAQVNITALAGFKSVTLSTESQYLIANGWPETIDLMTATAAEQKTLTDRGLAVKGLWKNVSTMALLDFAPMAEFLTAGTYRFTITATDLIGRTVEAPVTVELNLSEPEFDIATIEGEYYTKGLPTSFSLNANIPLSKENLKVEYQNMRGSTGEAEIVSLTEASRSVSYKITINTPTDIENKLVVKLICGRIGSNELTLNAVPFDLSVADNDVFATRAYMDIVPTGTTFPDMSGAQVVFQNANGSFTNASQSISGTTVDVSSLSADTEYTVRLKVGNNYSDAHTFRTEAATQLPNAGMEDWSITASKSNWELYYPAASQAECVWGTNNPMTTWYSETPMFSDYAYDKISGTKPTDDSHNGKAARISTQGWGSGNSALSGVSGKCQYIDAGLLHLGASRTGRPSGYGDRSGYLGTDDLDCGLAFASRPSALKFWYKYEAKNSADLGIANVYVYDSNGNVIASGTKELGSQGSYTEISIPLTYTRGAAKASKIYVCYMSTSVADALTKNSSWLNGPGFGNTSRGEYSGSRLYIDDIALTY